MAWQSRDIGVALQGASALTHNSVTAGSAADAAEQNGIVLDRQLDGRSLALSCKVIIVWSAALNADETLTLAANVRESAVVAMTAPSDIARGSKATFPAAVVATGGAGGTTEASVTELNVDLSGARRYAQLR